VSSATTILTILDPGVRAAFPRWSEPWEGWENELYLDAHKPVAIMTIGVGCAIQSLDDALALPFRLSDGSPASASAIAAEWARVRAMPGGLLAVDYRNPDALHALALADDAIEALVFQRLDADVAVLARFWPAFSTFPPAAQQALAGMAWALGVGPEDPGLTSPEWPHLHAAVSRQDWPGAAAQCAMKGPGLVGRNAAQKALFLQAAGAGAGAA
jgi:GH24 family phage-related lysozyme (muramidase)